MAAFMADATSGAGYAYLLLTPNIKTIGFKKFKLNRHGTNKP